MAIIPASGNNRSHLENGIAANGHRTDLSGRPVKNLVLLSIPDEEYNLIRPHLEFVELKQYLSLQEPGENIAHGYFPDEGMVSLVIATSDGFLARDTHLHASTCVEVAIVGREGIVGTPLAVGLNRDPYRAIIQISGNGWGVKASVLADALRAAPELRLLLNRHVLIQGLQVAQIAACNRLHEIERRLARWLLMCRDRVDSDLLPVTHEFLSQMLGTGRPSVTLAAGILQRAGSIENMRGTVRIVNRQHLEDAACECYQAMQHFNGGLRLG